jgi:hypothetical protein
MGYVEVAARLLVATVFAVALAGKVGSGRAYRAFVDSLLQMRVVPVRAARPAAAASVAAEVAVFAVAIAISLRGGNRAPCRCFGASATPLGRRHIVRNTVLVVIALAGLASAAGGSAVAVPGAVVAGGAGLVSGILVTAYDDIAALFQ